MDKLKARHLSAFRRYTRLSVRGLLWLIFSVGFLGTLWLLPPDLDDLRAPDATPTTREKSLQFILGTPTQKVEMSPFARPFLFQLAGNDKISGLERERNAKERYDAVLAALRGLKVPEVDTVSQGGMTLVTINKQPFLNVLPEDCPEYHARLSDEDKKLLELEVAHQWAELIVEDLTWRVFQQQPDYQKLFNFVALALFFLTGLLHLSLDLFCRRFLKHPGWSLKAVMWLTYLWLFTTMHPAIENFETFVRHGALRPLTLFIGVAVMINVCQHAMIMIIHWYFQILADLNAEGETARDRQRRATIKQAAIFASRIVLMIIGAVIYLYAMGADLSSFFAGAGLIGVAIGVLARDILLDIFYGINVIAEDQFGVGDWIESEHDLGEVVNFTLRATQIRKLDGSLMTIPNLDLRRVKNHSNEWSQVDYQVMVSYSTDTKLASEFMLEEAKSLMEERPTEIIETPTIMGVHDLDLNGVTLRLLIKTAPLAQWKIRRELNSRVKLRFEAEGVEFAATRHRVHLQDPPSSDERGTKTT